ncbi:hypothetical protein ACFQMM_05830 [Saliphagus sp. GCM10025308]
MIVPPFGAVVFAVASIMTGAITSDDLEEIAARLRCRKRSNVSCSN